APVDADLLQLLDDFVELDFANVGDELLRLLHLIDALSRLRLRDEITSELDLEVEREVVVRIAAAIAEIEPILVGEAVAHDFERLHAFADARVRKAPRE